MTEGQMQASIDAAVARGAKSIEVNIHPWLWLGNDTYQALVRPQVIAMLGPTGYAQAVQGLRVVVKLSYLTGNMSSAGVNLFGWTSGTQISGFTGADSFDVLMNTTPTASHSWLTCCSTTPTVMASIANDLQPAMMIPLSEPSSVMNSYSGISGTCTSQATNIGNFYSDAIGQINLAATTNSITIKPAQVNDYYEIGCAVAMYNQAVIAGNPPLEEGFDIYNWNPNFTGNSASSTPPAGLGSVNTMINGFKTASTPLKSFFISEAGPLSWCTTGTNISEACAQYAYGNSIWSASSTGVNRDMTTQATLWAQSQGITEMYPFPALMMSIAQIIDSTANNDIDQTQSVLSCTGSGATACSKTWGAAIATNLSVGTSTISNATNASPIVLTLASNPLTAGWVAGGGQVAQVSCSNAGNLYASNPATPYVTTAASSTTITLNNITAPGGVFTGTCVVYRPQYTPDAQWLTRWTKGLSVLPGVPLGL
jgi:hypothetical protein